MPLPEGAIDNEETSSAWPNTKEGAPQRAKACEATISTVSAFVSPSHRVSIPMRQSIRIVLRFAPTPIYVSLAAFRASTSWLMQLGSPFRLWWARPLQQHQVDIAVSIVWFTAP